MYMLYVTDICDLGMLVPRRIPFSECSTYRIVNEFSTRVKMLVIIFFLLRELASSNFLLTITGHVTEYTMASELNSEMLGDVLCRNSFAVSTFV